MLTTFLSPVCHASDWVASQGGTAAGVPPLMQPPDYFHAIPGRMRIKIAAVKGSPATAVTLEAQLRRACAGIDQVTANPTTGNVLIRYDPCQTGQQEILVTLLAQGWLPPQGLAEAATTGLAVTGQELSHALAKTLLRSAMKCALQQLVQGLL